MVVMTAYGTIESAVEAMRLGAEDYLVKPFEPARCCWSSAGPSSSRSSSPPAASRIRRNQERFTLQQRRGPKSPRMQGIFDLLRSVADLDTTVLIHGETGVGKELLARSIHFSGCAARASPSSPSTARRSPRSSSSPSSSATAGAPSPGPPSTRRGHFQMASGGTLLLDEIGEMPLHLQTKLLRAIEEKKVTSVGADRPVDIDVRFIATTNKDLQAEVERGAFRRDLFYRLSVMPIRVPAAPRAARGHPAPRRALPARAPGGARRR